MCNQEGVYIRAVSVHPPPASHQASTTLYRITPSTVLSVVTPGQKAAKQASRKEELVIQDKQEQQPAPTGGVSSSSHSQTTPGTQVKVPREASVPQGSSGGTTAPAGEDASTGSAEVNQKPRRRKKQEEDEEEGKPGAALPATTSRFSSLLELGDE
jgi:hypothetical protein